MVAEPEGGGWVFHGSGGALRQAGCPDLSVDRLQFRYQHPQLFIQEAMLRPDETGLFDVSGEIDCESPSRLDLLVKCSDVSITPWLPEDWRARLHGKLVGSAKVRAGLRDPGSMKADGSLSLVSSRLEALPILDRIALFTHTDQFRQFPLQTASADFSWERSKLVVTRLALESEGLIRIEGGFSVKERNLDGQFQVGVTASSLRWLPGSQSKVFTVERGGYLWAPMRVTGPVDRLQEDLSPRLAAAAETEVIEGAKTTIEQGAKGVLDLLSPLIP